MKRSKSSGIRFQRSAPPDRKSSSLRSNVPCLQIADVMQADVPRRAVAPERVCLSAALRVLFQHQNLHPGDPGQKAGGRQAAHSRSDDDCIPFRFHCHARYG